MKKTSDFLFALIIGVVAGVIRVACVFFPWFNIAEVLVFGSAGYWVGRRGTSNWFGSTAAIIFPSMAFIVFGLKSIGLEHLREGVGVLHLFSLVLLPLSVGIGMLFGAKRSPHSAAA